MQDHHLTIPDYIARHKALSSNEKLLYSLLISLRNTQGFCSATNKYLAERSNISERSIRRFIHNLAFHNLIVITIDKCHDRKIWIDEI